MVDFSKTAANSVASGFQNYDIQPFSFSTPGQFLPKFSGTISSYTNQVAIPKNRSGIALTSQILSSIQINLDNVSTPGEYFAFNSEISNNAFVGGSGAFYQYAIDVSADAENLYIILTIDNPSAEDDVTTPTIVVSGKVFLYLAPF